jgi:hypothetical protein
MSSVQEAIYGQNKMKNEICYFIILVEILLPLCHGPDIKCILIKYGLRNE